VSRNHLNVEFAWAAA